jgi:hypothetical protein
VLYILWRRSIVVKIVNDRQNLLLRAKQSEEANDRYFYSDQLPSRHATISVRVPHRTYTKSCTSTFKRTLKAIERTRTSGSHDLLIGHFSPFSHHLSPLYHRSIGQSTLHNSHPTLHSSQIIIHNHHRPS